MWEERLLHDLQERCPREWSSLLAVLGQHPPRKAPCTSETAEFHGFRPEEAGSKMQGVKLKLYLFPPPLPIPLFLENKANVT